MPVARTTKRKAGTSTKKGKGKVNAKAASPVVDNVPQAESSMVVDEADAAPDSASVTAQVMSAAEDSVEQATRTGSEDVVSAKASRNGPGIVTKMVEAAEEFVDQMSGMEAVIEAADEEEARITMEERRAKMDKLRDRLRTSTTANRKSLVEESTKAKLSARENARLERQRKLAETLRTKADAEDRGEDVERAKNWEWTIEENDEWEKKKARKARRADFEFHDDAHAARRRYKKDLDILKPDIAAYNRQKEIALGLAPGTLAKSGADSSSSTITQFDPNAAGPSTELVPTSEEQRLARENLYRDANSLLYADNKPSEDAIDRVISKINKDMDKKGKFSRKRANEDEGDITYINEHNRVFNKKIARYYDKYTSEIRASFERGTAL